MAGKECPVSQRVERIPPFMVMEVLELVHLESFADSYRDNNVRRGRTIAES